MSIVSAEGWAAVFAFAEGPAERPLVLWREDDGRIRGVILDERTGTLRDASSYPNFTGYRQSEVSPKSQLVPCEPGWWVVYKQDDGQGLYCKMIAWLVGTDGWSVRAVDTPDSDGVAMPVDAHERTCFVYAPDRREEGLGLWPDAGEPE